MANPPTLWAHFEAGELVNIEEHLADLGCSPMEAVRYEAFDEARDNATRLALLDELIALDDGSEDTLPVYRAVAMLRTKYTQPAEPGQESK